MPDSQPLVSIGMPIYNGEATLNNAIDSILTQSYQNIELIISDNHSADATDRICQEYSQKDSRVRFITQPENIGSTQNFKYVLDQAMGEYFLWAACDDARSPDFISESINFLKSNPDYVASTSPNCFEGQELFPEKFVTFSLIGNIEQRFHSFLDHCWESHGIFYSVIRTQVLRECDIPGQSFTAADWAIDLFLASRGNIHRTNKGLAVFGSKGISSRAGSWSAFRNQRIELILPFYRLTGYLWDLTSELSLPARIYILMRMIKLNFKAVFDQTHSALYQFYCAHVKQHMRSRLG